MGFANLIGEWTGQNSLWLRPDSPAFESPTSATIGAVAGGKVVTVNYTWTHEGEAQDGLILLAVDAAEAIHMAWCDSFHMDDKIMDLAGRVDGEVIAATGSYSIPGSEPWGWRVELEQINPESFQLRMYNLLPASMGGIEALAVRADYVRSGLAARTD
jgi:hypothetical protein